MPLKSTIDTPEIAEEVLAAFQTTDAYEAQVDAGWTVEATFEHDQWFILSTSGASWSVVDVGSEADCEHEEGNCDCSFDFEQLSVGEES